MRALRYSLALALWNLRSTYDELLAAQWPVTMPWLSMPINISSTVPLLGGGIDCVEVLILDCWMQITVVADDWFGSAEDNMTIMPA